MPVGLNSLIERVEDSLPLTWLDWDFLKYRSTESFQIQKHSNSKMTQT